MWCGRWRKRGYRIRVAVRRPELAGHLQPLGRVGQIHAVQANLRYAGARSRRRRATADVVINLVGILFERGRQRFEAVQAAGRRSRGASRPRRSARALVHVSAIGADESSPSHYAPQQGDGRDGWCSPQCPPPWSCGLRSCSAPEDDFFNRFAAMARISPALPLIGGGHTRFQPVFAGDVAASRRRGGRRAGASRGTIYELGGPDVRSFKELMEYVLATIERKRLLVPLPFALARLQASFAAVAAQAAAHARPGRAAARATTSSPSDAKREGRTLEGLGIEPVAIASVVPSYLWRFRKTGQFRGRVA